MKIWESIVLILGCLILAGSVVAGVLERSWYRKRHWVEPLEGKEGRTILQLHKPFGIYEAYFKRPLDFALASVALIVLSPVLFIIALLVKINLGSPVLFRQPRPGRDEKIFQMVKFRSMTDQRDEKGEFLPDEQRLTRFGAVLRATSLDELPELFCIWKGNMSMVGPRPQLVRDMVFMTPEQRERHSVRSGLTGLAQCNGRNCVSWDQKLAYDLQYINGGITFVGDLRILWKTALAVFQQKGIRADGMATAMDYGDVLLQESRITYAEYEERQRIAQAILAGSKWAKRMTKNTAVKETTLENESLQRFDVPLSE